MKLGVVASFCILLVSPVSVAAQGGKKGSGGGGGGDGGGKKGGLSMSMSMAPEIDVGPAFCNSGLVQCSAGILGCKESVNNTFSSVPDPNIFDTDGCLDFCANNMNAEEYYVQFRPGNRICNCFEGCANFVDISTNPNEFAALYAVGGCYVQLLR